MVGLLSRRFTTGLFICGVLLGACKKDDAGSGGSSGGTGGKNSDLTMIPADSELVLGLNFAQARDSALFRDYVLPRLTKDARLQASIEKIKTKCGFDPMTAVTNLTLGLRELASRKGDGVIVVHGLEKAKAMSCVDQMKDELAQEKVEVTKDGDVLLVKGDRPDETSAITFVDDKTALVVIGPKATKAGVLEAAQGKSALTTSKEFTDMYGRVKTSDTIWMLVNGSAEPVANMLSKLDVKTKAVFGSINMTDGLAIDMRMRVESAEQAETVAKLIGSQVAPFEQMADKLDIKNDGTDVRTQINISAEKLRTLQGMLGGLLRGRM